MTLARWQCHKIVRAGKITSISPLPSEPSIYPRVQEIGVQQAGGESRKIFVPENFFARGMAQLGDFYVEYDDDYVSWSPAHAFETGYRRMESVEAEVVRRLANFEDPNS